MPAHRSRPRASGGRAALALTSVAFDTPLGAMACAWRAAADGDPNLLRLTFGHNTRQLAWAALVRDLALDDCELDPLEELPEHELAARPRRLVTKLRRFAEGKRVDFSGVPVDAAHLAGFARKVHDACRKVAYGAMLSYGDLAAIAGSPRAARAVGNVMRQNRTPIVVPCHRVIAAGGKLGGYSAPAGLDMKRRLLELERGD